QFEDRLDGADGGHLRRLRIVESQKIAVAGAPDTTQPAALGNLTDQGPKIAKRMAADRVPPEQVAGKGRFDEIDDYDRLGDDLRHPFGVTHKHRHHASRFIRRNSTSPTRANWRDSLAPAWAKRSVGIRSSATCEMTI